MQNEKTIDDFIRRLEEEFEDLKPGTVRSETRFDELEMWDSMHVLLLIAMIDAEYDVLLSGEELKSVSSVQGLFDLLKNPG